MKLSQPNFLGSIGYQICLGVRYKHTEQTNSFV